MTCSVEGCSSRIKAVGLCGKHYKRLRTWGDVNASRHPERGAIAASLQIGVACTDADCLTWPHARSTNGYGYLQHEGKLQSVHTVVCQMTRGPRPSSIHEAAHSCGNGHLGCYNGRHLRWATPAENSADRVRHGTTGKGTPKPSSRGERNANAKLTAVDVVTIRSMSSDLSNSEIARRFGVHHSAIGRIRAGQTWAWL